MSPPEPAPPRWKKLVIAASAALAGTLLVLGVFADIAQLGVPSPRVTRALLWAVGLTFLLYFVVQLWQLYFVEKIRELKADLTTAADTLAQLRSAVERINDREKLWSSETLELAITIGVDDDTDLIVERRVTVPQPLVTSRTMRPIVPTYGQRQATLDSIGFTAERDDGEIVLYPLCEEINRLKVLLVFEPAITTKTAWRVGYRPKGLWRPLRERGYDSLGWDDRLQNTNGSPSAFTSFQATFTFPKGKQPSVTERRGSGRAAAPVQKDDETWEVVWRDEHPAGRRYDWDLTQPVNGDQKPAQDRP